MNTIRLPSATRCATDIADIRLGCVQMMSQGCCPWTKWSYRYCGTCVLFPHPGYNELSFGCNVSMRYTATEGFSTCFTHNDGNCMVIDGCHNLLPQGKGGKLLSKLHQRLKHAGSLPVVLLCSFQFPQLLHSGKHRWWSQIHTRHLRAVINRNNKNQNQKGVALLLPICERTSALLPAMFCLAHAQVASSAMISCRLEFARSRESSIAYPPHHHQYLPIVI